MSYFVVGYICLGIGTLFGWCLRVGMDRAMAELRAIEQQRMFKPIRTGLIARLE